MLGDEGFFLHVTDNGEIVNGSGNWASMKTNLLAALASVGRTYSDDQVSVSTMGYALNETIDNWTDFEEISQ